MHIWILCVVLLSVSATTLPPPPPSPSSAYDVLRGTEVVNRIIEEWQGKIIIFSTSRIQEFLERTMQLCHMHDVEAIRDHMDSVGAHGIGVGTMMYSEDPSGYVTLSFIDLTAITDTWDSIAQARDALTASLKGFYDFLSGTSHSFNSWSGVVAAFAVDSRFGAVAQFVTFQTRLPSWSVTGESLFIHLKHK